jgi:hypothetical protein
MKYVNNTSLESVNVYSINCVIIEYVKYWKNILFSALTRSFHDLPWRCKKEDNILVWTHKFILDRYQLNLNKVYVINILILSLKLINSDMSYFPWRCKTKVEEIVVYMQPNIQRKSQGIKIGPSFFAVGYNSSESVIC